MATTESRLASDRPFGRGCRGNEAMNPVPPSPAGSAPAPLVPGTLYLVATPVGNLEDITLRALRVLRDCDAVAAEDTRHTGHLLHHFGLHKPLFSYHRFNEARRSGEILGRLRAGQVVALVTDAGSPGISDPGQRVVATVLAGGGRVEAVPGACAMVAALTASGLPTDEFHFAGFLPVKSGQRARRLGELLAMPGTLCLYESPHRIAKLVQELAVAAPGRPVVLARELTKKFEEWIRGDAAAVAAELARRPRKGEFVVMVGPAGEPRAQDDGADGDGEPDGVDGADAGDAADPDAG